MNRKEFHSLGMRRIAAICHRVKVGDVNHNVQAICSEIEKNSDADIILFPELCVTGYTCADLFNQNILLEAATQGICDICKSSEPVDACVCVGAPLEVKGKLYNCAILICKGKVEAIVPKIYVPNYGEYYEGRWFASGAPFGEPRLVKFPKLGETPFGTNVIINFNGMKIGAEICEDLWVPVPPSCGLTTAGADIIVNLSASNETIGKRRYRNALVSQQSARCRCVYAYASAGQGESSTDLAFPPNLIIAENGRILAQSEPFVDSPVCVRADVDLEKLHHDRRAGNTFLPAPDSIAEYEIIDVAESENPVQKGDDAEFKLIAPVDPHPFVPSDIAHRNENCIEIVNIQCWGLRQRLEAIGCKNLVIGVSGGLDSTLALLIACRTFDMAGYPRSGIYGITMPGLATTDRTHNNAWQLMRLLGVTAIEIPINAAVNQHFSDIGQDPHVHDATYENSQARMRTMILMDYANKVGGIVLGTGDLSELALGWCTYNGDHMSMYGVNASVPKTLVKYLVEWFAAHEYSEETSKVLEDIVATPISPELVPAEGGADEIAQKTEDLVGPYELHDFFLYQTLRNAFTPKKIRRLAEIAFEGKYDVATIGKWLKNFYRRFFNQQFKRSCMPDGPKVGSVCLSPRGDWRMPSDASSALWLE